MPPSRELGKRLACNHAFAILFFRDHGSASSIQDAPLCLLVCSTGYDEGADCESIQGWHCLYRSGAERATCFYSQSAHRTNAQAADWFEFPIVRCFLRPLRSSRESCIAERISSTTDEIARE